MEGYLRVKYLLQERSWTGLLLGMAKMKKRKFLEKTQSMMKIERYLEYKGSSWQTFDIIFTKGTYARVYVILC